MSKNTELTKAMEKRDAFLREHPHLQKQQDDIDALLDKCRPEDRFQVITMLLTEQMQKQLALLNAVKKGLENGQITV